MASQCLNTRLELNGEGLPEIGQLDYKWVNEDDKKIRTDGCGVDIS